MINSLLQSNTATSFSGGGISSEESITSIESSTVINNEASAGGGIFIRRPLSSLTIKDSSISNNSASGVGGGICSFYRARVSVTNTTIEGNRSARGGGLCLYSEAKVVNSTISGNSASIEGGGFILGQANVTLNNVTVSGNSALSRGGNLLLNSFAALTMTNSILANSNTEDCYIVNGEGFISADDSNIIQDGSCGTSALSINPRLGSLQFNGGTTKTHALLSGSLAINSGNGISCETFDQRGFERVGNCDIGAFEFIPSGPPVPPPPPSPTPFNPASVVPPIMLLLGDEE